MKLRMFLSALIMVPAVAAQAQRNNDSGLPEPTQYCRDAALYAAKAFAVAASYGSRLEGPMAHSFEVSVPEGLLEATTLAYKKLPAVGVHDKAEETYLVTEEVARGRQDVAEVKLVATKINFNDGIRHCLLVSVTQPASMR